MTARGLVNASVSDNERSSSGVYAGDRRNVGDLDRGLALPFTADDLATVLATCHLPRRRGRGVEFERVAAARGRLVAVIAGLLFMGGMQQSEVSSLRWTDVEDAGDDDGILVTVHRSKTNQVGETSDVRYLKNGPARAVPALRAAAGLERRGTAQLRTGRFGDRARQPRGVDYRPDARRKPENLKGGRPLLRRCDRHAPRRGALPLVGVN